MRRALVVAPALLLMLAACGSDDGPDFAAAHEKCSEIIDAMWQEASPAQRGIFTRQGFGLDAMKGALSVGDSGRSVIADSLGKAGQVVQYAVVTCLADELGAPDTLRQKLGQTSALDGRQSESWGDVEMSWSYSPDSGLTATFSGGR